jgi:hypothetical protein
MELQESNILEIAFFSEYSFEQFHIWMFFVIFKVDLAKT